MAIDTLRIREPNVDADGEALASGGETPASTRGAGLHQQVQHLADGPLSPDGLGQGQVPLDLVGVPTAVPVLYYYYVARLGQVGELAYALRSVMSSAAAMSRRRTPGSLAMQRRARAWLVKKLQFATPLPSHFWNGIASVRCGVRASDDGGSQRGIRRPMSEMSSRQGCREQGLA